MLCLRDEICTVGWAQHENQAERSAEPAVGGAVVLTGSCAAIRTGSGETLAKAGQHGTNITFCRALQGVGREEKAAGDPMRP